MKIKKIITALFIVVICCSCSESKTRLNQDIRADSNVISNAAEVGSSVTLIDTKQKGLLQRKIIWIADLELQVNNVDEATKYINKICLKYNAFVSKMSLMNSNHQISNSITIRVGNEYFNTLINDVKAHAVYTRKATILSDDVTEEFVDIESRLKTKRSVRDRYIHILKNKTGSITDVIEAEEAIRKITEEIEAKEGRLRFLKDKVNFSTINLQLFQKVNNTVVRSFYEKSFFSKSWDAIKNGWNLVSELFLGLLSVWPFLILLFLFLWKRKWLLKIVETKK